MYLLLTVPSPCPHQMHCLILDNAFLIAFSLHNFQTFGSGNLGIYINLLTAKRQPLMCDLNNSYFKVFVRQLQHLCILGINMHCFFISQVFQIVFYSILRDYGMFSRPDLCMYSLGSRLKICKQLPGVTFKNYFLYFLSSENRTSCFLCSGQRARILFTMIYHTFPMLCLHKGP